jgi:hypothetical protein
MRGVWPREAVFALAIATASCAAGRPPSQTDLANANDTGRTIGAKSEGERAILRELPTLPSGKSRRVLDATVQAADPYAAASGNTCRALQIEAGGKTSSRLACNDGKAWFFVPGVFFDAEATE